MARTIEQPVTAAGHRGDETTTTHPAFGNISASRVNGTHTLYGSDFTHNGFMSITIMRSEHGRSHCHDWHYGTDELIEVSLTEAQWATFVSSPNVGSGVPCTIEHIQGKRMPGLPDPISRSDQFAGELRKTMEASLLSLQTAIAEIDGMGLPKAKAGQIKARISTTMREISANMPYVAQTFEQHVEQTIEKGKAEFHGYMTAAMQRAGVAAIAGGGLPLQIGAAPAQSEED